MKLQNILNSLRGSSLSNELIVSLRGLVVLYRSGIPVARAMSVLSTQAVHPRLREVFLKCRQHLEAGKSIAYTLSFYPDVFPELYIRLIEVGERTGRLEEMLEKIASHAEKSLEKSVRLKTALIYPSFMLVICLGFLILGPVFILRGILDFLTGLSISLPPSTRLLISVSLFMRSPWFWIMLLTVCIGGFFSVRRLWQVYSVRRSIQFFFLSVPGLGALLRLAEVSTFARTMSTIYDSGMPLLQGLELVQKTTGIIVYRESLGFVLQHVADGEALKDALTQTGMFPPVLLQLLAAGEESGEIAKMLDWAAKICEQNLDQSIETFLELLQPFILILIGGIVGFLLIATLAPMLKVINGIT